MDRWVRQFHGFEEVTGREGRSALRTGEETGVTIATEVGERGAVKAWGGGANVAAPGDATAGSSIAGEEGDRGGITVRTLAPPCNNSLRTSLLPLATETWIESFPFRSGTSKRDGVTGVPLSVISFSCSSRTRAARWAL